MASTPTLVWERSDGSRQVFELPPHVVEIGRDATCAICLDEPLVSRRHATIERQGERVVVRDLGSTNRTRVNGVVVAGEAELQDGDEVHFARAHCRFVRESERAQEPEGGGNTHGPSGANLGRGRS
jgi:pSer/pThr/pTyr-binding forkhead associated (FHA) protein